MDILSRSLLCTIHNIIYIYTGRDRSWHGKSPIRHKKRGMVFGKWEVGAMVHPNPFYTTYYIYRVQIRVPTLYSIEADARGDVVLSMWHRGEVLGYFFFRRVYETPRRIDIIIILYIPKTTVDDDRPPTTCKVYIHYRDVVVGPSYNYARDRSPCILLYCISQ